MARPKRKITRTELQALEKAVRHFGSMSALADQLRISRQALVKWSVNGIPLHHVMLIERLTGVPRQHLRPDRY